MQKQLKVSFLLLSIISTFHKHVYQKDKSIYISNNYSHSYFKASGIPGGNDESTSILIDKALEHQSSLHVRYNDFISLCLQGL